LRNLVPSDLAMKSWIAHNLACRRERQADKEQSQ
jgi:hypothetical protein